MRKCLTKFYLNFWIQRGAKACKSCRSRQELSNEHLLSKFGVDTAESGPLKVRQKIISCQRLEKKLESTQARILARRGHFPKTQWRAAEREQEAAVRPKDGAAYQQVSAAAYFFAETYVSSNSELERICF